MRRSLAALTFLAGLLPALAGAQVPNFPQTVPANTVLGRLGINAGPVQAIPIARIQASISGVSSVALSMPAIFSVTGSPVTSTGTLAVQAAGTSGGVPYFSSATSLASSAVLSANSPVLGGGAGAAPTVGSRSGNTTVFGTVSGSLIAGNCVKSDASGNLVDFGAVCGGGGGGGTPGGANTQVQFNSLGTFGGSANLTWVSPTLTIGVTGSITGQLQLAGATSGLITMAGQSAAGTYNWNLPTGAGSANQPLLSGGGGATPMSFGSVAYTTSATSGGLPYFNTATSMASSGLLTANGVLYGGGVGTAPGATTAGSSGQLLLGVTSGAPQFATLSQDCTVTNSGVITCARTGNVVFGPFATQTAPCSISQGCTGQITAAAARQSSGLNLWGDQGTAHGDSNYSILSTDRMVFTNATLTAARTWTLPAANVTGAPFTEQVTDMFGGVNGGNTLTINRAGADTINGGTSVTISVANGSYICSSDGISKWSCQSTGPASAGGVSSITAGFGLTGGTITTSGTITAPLIAMYSYSRLGGI